MTTTSIAVKNATGAVVQVATLDALLQNGLKVTSSTTASFNAQVVGSVAGGSPDSGNPLKAGAVYHAAPVVYADGARTDLQADAAGALKVNVTSGSFTVSIGSVTVSNTVSITGSVSVSNIASVSGTVTISNTVSTTMSGVALAANQTALIGSASPGTPASSSMLVGGIYATPTVSLTNGQQASHQLDNAGNLKVNVAAGSFTVSVGTITVSNTVSVFGNVASGSADSGAPVKIGGIYHTASIVLAEGQRGDVQLDASGSIKVNVTSGSFTVSIGTVTVSNTVSVTGTVSITGTVAATVAGVATAANQALTIGTKTPGTAATSASLAAGVFTTSSTTLSEGQQIALMVTNAGLLKIDGGSSAAVTIKGQDTTSAMSVSNPVQVTGTVNTDARFINGTAITAGQGATTTGSLRVTFANDAPSMGPRAAGTAAATASLGAGWYTTASIVLTEGQQIGTLVDVNGYLRVTGGVTQGSTSSGQLISPVAGFVTTAPPTYTTANSYALSLTPTGALRIELPRSTPKLCNALTTVSQTVSTTASVLTDYYIANPNTASVYVQIFDTATFTLGTTLPKWSLGIPNGGANVSGLNLNFTTGIYVAAATTVTGSTAPTTSIDANFGSYTV